MHVTAKTLGHWEKSETLPNAEAKQHLAKVKEIAELAHIVYSPECVKNFLSTPMEVFDRYTALDLIRST